MKSARRGLLALARGLSWLGVTGVLAGCSDPAIVTIARGDAPDSRAARGPRGRPSIVDGQLVTDRGSLLRGISVEADLGLDFQLIDDAPAARATVGTFFDRLALELGLNAFEVYLESWNVAPGSRAAFADVLVEESERAGIYLIFGPGSGPIRNGMGGTGWFDAAFIAAFWDFYAPRYAGQSHVIYQLQKVPDRTCDGMWSGTALELERDGYTRIRSLAPDSHVLLFSFAETPTSAAFEANVGAVSDAVSWQNASVAFHAHDECAPVSEIGALPRDLPGGRVSLLATELPPSNWQPNLRALEQHGVGWMHFHWIAVEPDLSTFRDAHEQAGVSWCPDFGTWPVDSSGCGGT